MSRLSALPSPQRPSHPMSLPSLTPHPSSPHQRQYIRYIVVTDCDTGVRYTVGIKHVLKTAVCVLFGVGRHRAITGVIIWVWGLGLGLGGGIPLSGWDVEVAGGSAPRLHVRALSGCLSSV